MRVLKSYTQNIQRQYCAREERLRDISIGKKEFSVFITKFGLYIEYKNPLMGAMYSK